MTIQAAHFTPEVLLSAPRRSSGVPNITGELILYTVSTYCFKSQGKTSQIRVLNVEDGSSHLVSEDSGASEPVWISKDEVAYSKAGEHGSTVLVARNVLEKKESEKYEGFSPPRPKEPYRLEITVTDSRVHFSRDQIIQHFPVSISNLKTKILSSGKVAFVCSALTTPDGKLHEPNQESKPRSSAKIYDSLFVRHWDSWATEAENSLWYGQLSRAGNGWALDSPGLRHLLAGTKLRSPPGPFGGTGDFDISENGVAFVAKDPKLNPARYTKTNLYYVPVSSFSQSASHAPQIIRTNKLQGYSSSPTFSHDGKKIAFTRMKNQKYETDKRRLLVIPDVEDLANVQEFYQTKEDKGAWDRSPNAIVWSPDDKQLFTTAEEHGRTKLWVLPSSPLEAKELPKLVHGQGTVADVRNLGSSPRLFLSCQSRVESSTYCVLDLEKESIKEISSSSKGGKTFGLSASQCFDTWYPGSRGYDNHALVMTPSNFDKKKKYPLAFLIHGGPQAAWSDSWSTRWNPAVFAEQGYVTVSPNPTGSSGYGQEHTDAITGDWGGAPYEDLVKCFEYIEREFGFVDIDRAVALGASYGGYMINWIQGQPLGRKFKALVCHDGVFSTRSQWSTEELFFPEHDFQGTLWDNREGYEKWDPSFHTDKWETPMLVIHNELDYRLCVSEGLAMFNVLQARGVPSKLIVFPDENHWVLKPENSLVWHKEVIGWINKYSGISRESGIESQTEALKL